MHVFFAADLAPAVKKALRREKGRMHLQEEFPCKTTAKLNAAVVDEYMPHARSGQTWTRTESWLTKFFDFAGRVCKESGKFRTQDQCLASNVMCRHFLASVAEEKRGVSRPRSARMVLSAERQRRGWKTLNDDHAISAIVRGAENSRPRTKKQAASLSVSMLRFIARRWGSAKSWWKRQMSLLSSLGFVSLMRMGELVAIEVGYIYVVFKDGSDVPISSYKELPDLNAVEGVLIHLPWRKNHQSMDCWIPITCKTTLKLLWQQVLTLRRKKCQSDYLFPSRHGSKPSKANHVSASSAKKGLRHALLECVPLMTKEWSLLFSGHSLRVGGSNFMRKLGVHSEVHRKMGGWMSLVAAQGYMAMSTQEQFAYTLALAKNKSRVAGLTKHSAKNALCGVLRPLTF